MEENLLLNLNSLLEKTNLNDSVIKWLTIGISLFVIIVLAWGADIITKRGLLRMLNSMAKKTRTQWDDILLEKKVFDRLAHIVPAIIVYQLVGLVLIDFEVALNFIKAGIKIYIIIMVLLSIDSFLNSLHKIYDTLPFANDRPIKGYVQILKIIVYFVAIILIISIVTGKTPLYFFAGLGTMAAVLMLVFKDTILGFVASIQLSSNDMVRIGEWISMPSQGADGTVEEINLTTVKVQNWDKTISTIPTYALVSESFTNWRGMEESGGRRIKRSIQVDMKSVKFCTQEMVDKFSKIKFLNEYIKNKELELNEYNSLYEIDDSVKVNGRRMTNLGTFRKYLEQYLKHHPKIHQELTFLVRQLQPTENGIPIEIYVFSKEQNWANYEAIQADIFDHILAVIPEFELNVFQNPSGDDFRRVFN